MVRSASPLPSEYHSRNKKLVCNQDSKRISLHIGPRRAGGRVAQVSVSFFLPVPKLWVPRPCVLGKGGYDAACTIGFVMPSGLHRTYGAHHLHFITCSCYRRLPFLSSARGRERFLSILEQTRQRYGSWSSEGPAATQPVWKGATAQSVLAGALL
jgi:hypothetical protein